MFCQNCGYELYQQDRFCSKCGSQLNVSNSGTSIKANDNNINAIGSHIENSSININSYNNSNLIDSNLLNLKRKFVKLPWSLDGKIGSISTFFNLGTLGSIASIISIIIQFSGYGLEDSGNGYFYISLFILAFSSIFLVTSLLLKRRKFSSFSKNNNLESGSNGGIFLTKIAASCPWCSSDMDLKMVGPKNHKEHLLICQRNPSQHTIIFDYTAMPDIEE